MKNEISIGKWEATFLLLNLVGTKIFLGFPRVMAETAGPSGWILTLYISLLAFVGFYVAFKLYKKFERKDLLDIGEYVGGAVGRIVVGLIVIAFLLLIVSMILREFSENFKITALEASPISFVMVFFIACMVISAYFGIEAITRIHIILSPINIVLGIFIAIAVSNYYNFANIFPILGNGVNDLFGKGFLRVSMYSELLIFFIIAPYLKNYKKAKSVGYTTIGLSAFFMLMATLVTQFVFPYPAVLESFLPVYQLARLINYGRFFQRVESLFILIWASAAILYLSSGFYFIVFVFKKTFKLDYYRPLILPFAILVFTICLLPESLMSALKIVIEYFRNTSALVTFGFTIILLLAATVKFRMGKKARKAE